MKDNEKLKAIAIKVLDKTSVEKDEVYGFAIITVLMIISIMLTCIRIIQECNKNKISKDFTAQEKYKLYGEEIKTYSERRGWFTKMRIKKVLRREMKPDDYNKYSMSILASLLDTGENLTEEELQTLVEAANV
ncbi:hypothetical protein EB077_06635 [bacterium]|nr:hypothetical protein [bacterium]NDC94962.1 hypothetical protein [bacterium]